MNGADGKTVRQLKHGGEVTGLAVRPDGTKIAVVGLDKSLACSTSPTASNSANRRATSARRKRSPLWIGA